MPYKDPAKRNEASRRSRAKRQAAMSADEQQAARDERSRKWRAEHGKTVTDEQREAALTTEEAELESRVMAMSGAVGHAKYQQGQGFAETNPAWNPAAHAYLTPIPAIEIEFANPFADSRKHWKIPTIPGAAAANKNDRWCFWAGAFQQRGLPVPPLMLLPRPPFRGWQEGDPYAGVHERWAEDEPRLRHRVPGSQDFVGRDPDNLRHRKLRRFGQPGERERYYHQRNFTAQFLAGNDTDFVSTEKLYEIWRRTNGQPLPPSEFRLMLDMLHAHFGEAANPPVECRRVVDGKRRAGLSRLVYRPKWPFRDGDDADTKNSRKPRT